MHCSSTATSFNELLPHQVLSMFILLLCHYGSSSIFHFFPKRDESQKVLDLPAFKIVKPSDTRCLAHERCVKAVVKTTY